MQIKAFQKLVDLKVYEWSLKRAAEEAENEFSILNKAASRYALSFLLCSNSLSKREKSELAEALVTLAHQRTLQAEGIRVSAKLKSLATNFKIRTQDLARSNFHPANERISKTELGRAVLRVLEQSLGYSCEQVGYFSWVLDLSVGSYLLETKVTLGQYPQLDCQNSIFYLYKGIKVDLLKNTDIFQILGLGTLKLDLITDNNFEQVSQNLAYLCEEFLKLVTVISESNLAVEDLLISLPASKRLNPDFHLVNSAFELRLYNWAKLDAERELVNKFQYLRKIKGGSAVTSLFFIESLDKSRKSRFLKSILKQSISYKTFILTNEVWTDEDQYTVEEFRLFCQNLPRPELHHQIQQLLQSKTKLSSARVRSLVRTELKPVLGKPLITNNVPEIIFRTVVNVDWCVYTLIDCGGNYQIRYEHYISSNSYGFRIGPINISFMKWLGLGETTWDLLNENDLPVAVNTLKELCIHLIDALPILLDGIQPVSPWLD